ncbi:MAG: four helix bundle protein [Kofleriaceae bacterium]
MKGENISIRLRCFAACVITLCRALPKEIATTHIARQLIRAATSGGANYEEARGAESRDDFAHKIAIANKEMREALYWLQLIDEANLAPGGMTVKLAKEADELVAILTSSLRTVRNSA